jgi:hypothetical protein
MEKGKKLREKSKDGKEENKQEVLGKNNRLISFDTTRTVEKTTPPAILLCRRNVFTECLY